MPRKISRILIWNITDLTSTVGLKFLEIQWLNCYEVSILPIHKVKDLDIPLFTKDFADYSRLNFVIWDPDESDFNKIKAINPYHRQTNGPCWGYVGKKNPPEKKEEVEYEIDYIATEDMLKNFRNTWNILKRNSVSQMELVNKDKFYMGQAKLGCVSPKKSISLALKEQIEAYGF